jgi:phosphate transport system permease protein
MSTLETHATVLPSYDDDAAPASPRTSIGQASAGDRFDRYGGLVAGLGLTWLLTQRILPLEGLAWFLIVWFVTSIAMTVLVTLLTGAWTDVKDRVAGMVVTTGALVVGTALTSTVVFVLARGLQPLLHPNFYSETMAGVGPRDPYNRGGILHAIVGTLIELALALAWTLPLGIGTAIFMTEVGGRFAKVVRTVVEAMTALPSIVAGLFIYTVFIVALGVPSSGLAASLAIGVMMLPIIARAADVVLRIVPGGLREAGLALGSSKWRVVWHVILPTARPGLATAVILGVARGIGETSPVLLTSGASSFLVTNPTGGVMNSLPLYIFTTVRSGEPASITRAFAAATVLLGMVLTLFVIARLIARPKRTKKVRVLQPRPGSQSTVSGPGRSPSPSRPPTRPRPLEETP